MAEISYEIIVLTRPRDGGDFSLNSLDYRAHCLECIYLSRRIHSIHIAGLNIACRPGGDGGCGLRTD